LSPWALRTLRRVKTYSAMAPEPIYFDLKKSGRRGG
jgi:hypothetical protein